MDPTGGRNDCERCFTGSPNNRLNLDTSISSKKPEGEANQVQPATRARINPHMHARQRTLEKEGHSHWIKLDILQSTASPWKLA